MVRYTINQIIPKTIVTPIVVAIPFFIRTHTKILMNIVGIMIIITNKQDSIESPMTIIPNLKR
jgi:hypothetical protein